jgi:hypothetical protein
MKPQVKEKWQLVAGVAGLIIGLASLGHDVWPELIPESTSSIVVYDATGCPAAVQLMGPDGKEVATNERGVAPILKRWVGTRIYICERGTHRLLQSIQHDPSQMMMECKLSFELK